MNQDQINNAIPITGEEYMNLQTPEFVGQTRPDKEFVYHMYWRQDGVIYRTTQNLDIPKVVPMTDNRIEEIAENGMNISEEANTLTTEEQEMFKNGFIAGARWYRDTQA